MGGVTPEPGGALGAESIRRQDRWIIAASLVLVTALAWIYLWREAASMNALDMPGMPGMTMAEMALVLPPAEHFALTFLMWAVMMVGMMLPGAAPTILAYGALVRKNGERGAVLPAAWIFISGYLAVWTGFSVAATLLQIALEKAALLTPMMVSANRGLSAAILVAAGIYQWLPFKARCLRHCQNPLQFFLTHWRPGAAGTLRMGVESGTWCLGCCWALMLILFVAGVMNLLWIALITGFVLVEKLLPAGRFGSTVSGALFVLAGLVVLL